MITVCLLHETGRINGEKDCEPLQNIDILDGICYTETIIMNVNIVKLIACRDSTGTA